MPLADSRTRHIAGTCPASRSGVPDCRIAPDVVAHYLDGAAALAAGIILERWARQAQENVHGDAQDRGEHHAGAGLAVREFVGGE